MKTGIYFKYNIVIVVYFIGIFLGYTSMENCLIAMLLRLFWCNKEEIVLISFFIGLPAIGFIFQTFHIPIFGSVLTLFIASIISFKRIINYALNQRRSVLMLFVVLIIFSTFYFIGPMNDYAAQKLVQIWQTGILSFVSFLLLSNTEEVDMKTIAQFYLLFSILMIVSSFEYWGFDRPNGFTDFTFIRNTVISFQAIGFDNIINYQQIGISALLGLAFFLSSKRNFNIEILFFASIIFWITLISGARQAIFGTLMLLIFWLILKGKTIQIKIIFLISLVIILISYILKNTNIDYLQTSMDSSKSFQERTGGRDFEAAIKIFFDKPWTGSGLGGFYNPNNSNSKYPHNIFLELLCETGLLGLFTFTVILILFIKQSNITLHYSLPNQSIFVMIWIVYFLRSIISGDLGENVILFTSILALKKGEN